ncbi:MAG: TIGR03663 family protein [Anaerolineae bacterium]|nr:TIGR03663 family protein [Anaerolineae bacterium]
MKNKTKPTLLDTPIFERWHINLEVALYILLAVVATVAVFYNLGARTISHDESLHALYSWKLYAGQGYEHNPMMHGPFLFHANALAYFLLGSSDFAARIVPALFGIALVLLPAFLRKELGRVGALAVAALTLISPSTLFHARYIRNDIYMMVWAMLMAIALFRYLDSRHPKWLYLGGLAITLSMCTKETAYIAGFIGFTFVVILFLRQMLSGRGFSVVYILGLAVLISLVVGILVFSAVAANAPAAAESQEGAASGLSPHKVSEVLILFAGIDICMLLGAILVRRDERFKQPLTLMTAYVIAIGALAVCCTAVGGLLWGIVTQLPEGILSPQVFLVLQVVVAGVGAAAGAYGWWVLMGYARERKWLPAGFDDKAMYITLAVVVIPFVLLYTTFFTNPKGLGSGTVGAISYWLAQQEVKRAGQPWFYYLIVTPLYEFLPVGVGLTAIFYYLITGKIDRRKDLDIQTGGENKPSPPFVAYCVYWTLAAWLIYSWAGEKMPWLMVHVAQPMIVLSGRLIDDLVYGIDWGEVWRKGGWVLLLITPIVLWALGLFVFLPFFGQAFGGVSLTDINDTSMWLMALVTGGVLAYVGWRVRGKIGNAAAWRVAVLAVLLVLGAFTVRYAVMACYINYDTAQEFLVYAHSTPDVKQTVAELKEISRRLYGDERSIKFAYSSDATWPFEWYFDVNFPNRVFMGQEPTRENTDVPVLVIGRAEIPKVEPYLGKRYYRFDRKLIWWPHQDYYMGLSLALTGQDMGKVILKGDSSLTVELQGQTVELFVDQRTVYRQTGGGPLTLQNIDVGNRLAGRVVKRDDGTLLIRKATVLEPYKHYFFLDMQDPQKRREFLDVVFYRKYTQSLADWEPSHPYALYVRKDIAAQLWDFGVVPAGAVDLGESEETYAGNLLPIKPVSVWGSSGMGEGQFSAPRNVAVGPDGSVYVLDSGNARVQKFTAGGTWITAWGHECRIYDAMQGCQQADGAGGFSDPWGIAVDEDGNVYVADTWNHRIQKFTGSGEFVTMWGQYNIADTPSSMSGYFWGPRAVVVKDELVYVSDTGNKRVQVFTLDGQFVIAWGGKGIGDGEFDEPVGLALDAEGRTFVADTWNQRIQVFESTHEDGSGHFYLRKWELDSWYGQGLENKPYLAVDGQGYVFVGDPEGARILVFDSTGKFLATLGGHEADEQVLIMPLGLAVDDEGYVYVVDVRANRVLKLRPFGQ